MSVPPVLTGANWANQITLHLKYSHTHTHTHNMRRPVFGQLMRGIMLMRALSLFQVLQNL